MILAGGPPTLLALVCFLSVWSTNMVHAQQHGWNANPEVVVETSKRRPEFNFHEGRTPDYDLPDPLLNADGSKVQSVEDWHEQRSEMFARFGTLVYGRSPGGPDTLRFDIVEEDPQAIDGSATLKRLAVVSTQSGREHRFEFSLFLPNAVSPPVPVFLLINNRGTRNTDPTRQQRSGFWPVEEAIARGYGIAAYQNRDLAPDDAERYREGVIELFEGDQTDRSADAWMALAAWGWGASRVMDYFETDPGVDASRVAVLGHSRGGKASLWAGARDERFALVISNNSGCGGAALSRRRFGETVARINKTFPHWFCDNLSRYNDSEDNLPLDQHMLVSLVAPRAVYIASADEDLWADPRGEFLSLSHASPVYALWGHKPIAPSEMPPLDHPLISGPRGYHVRSGRHNLTAADWNRYMDFADTLWPRQKGTQ